MLDLRMTQSVNGALIIILQMNGIQIFAVVQNSRLTMAVRANVILVEIIPVAHLVVGVEKVRNIATVMAAETTEITQVRIYT